MGKKEKELMMKHSGIDLNNQVSQNDSPPMEVKGISSKTGSKLAFDPAKFMNIPNASQFTLIKPTGFIDNRVKL